MTDQYSHLDNLGLRLFRIYLFFSRGYWMWCDRLNPIRSILTSDSNSELPHIPAVDQRSHSTQRLAIIGVQRDYLTTLQQVSAIVRLE